MQTKIYLIQPKYNDATNYITLYAQTDKNVANQECDKGRAKNANTKYRVVPVDLFGE